MGALVLDSSVVIATGQVDGADRVVTADKRWGAVDARVEVVGA